MSACEVIFRPLNRSVSTKPGTTLLKAAAEAGITINNLCGGDGICGRCKMTVTSGKVSGNVSGRLSAEEIDKGVVLGCMACVESDVEVLIPEETLAKHKSDTDTDAQRFSDLEELVRTGRHRLSPLVRKVYLELDPPTLSSNAADHQRLCAEVKKRLHVGATRTGLPVMRDLPRILRESEFRVTATVGVRDNIAEVMQVEAGNTEERNYMVVIDIGTTTIVAHLLDATALKTVDGRACFNSQGVHGREVTARLIAAEKFGVGELQKALVGDINQLIGGLAGDNGVDTSDITAVVCAGNTAMGHFLLALPVETIRRTPYVAASVEPPPLRASDIGIKVNPRGLLYSLPGISGWVGSDLTAGILATGMHESDDTCLLVDIGTNGEVIVGNKEWLMACSASAGPALEGASVECGMRAERGAVEKVYAKNGKIEVGTIGDAAPIGICGSGIIDLVGVLHREGYINRSGKFVKDDPERVSVRDGVKSYALTDDGRVFITETDIENIITAKAAIFAAMKILLGRLDLSFGDVKHFYLAGAFGNYIDIDNAICIGLIPDLPRDRVKFVGNTSLKGAKLVALCREALDDIIAIEKSTTYYDLMGANDYVDEFRKAMFLPHTDIEMFQSCGA